MTVTAQPFHAACAAACPRKRPLAPDGATHG